MSEEVTNETIPSTPERPAGLPEKFQSVEAMAESYSQLEKKLHTKEPQGIPDKAETAPEVVEKDTQEAPQETTQEDPPEGLSLAEFEAEYQETGGLSEESYTKLKNIHKLSKADVQDLIEIRTQKANAERERIFSTIDGGINTYNSAIQWAAEALSADDKLSFNEAIKQTPYLRDLAVKDLVTRFKAAGSPVKEDPDAEPKGKPITNAAAASGSLGETFGSRNEYIQAMRGPKYKNNQAYREQVIAKAKRSGLI